MCKLKSAIVLKDRIYVPDHDSHDKMLSDLGIKDTKRNAETKFVRVELFPQDGDIFSPVDNWVLAVDQDIRPDWFFEEIEKPKIIEAVKQWAKDRIFSGVDNLELKDVGTYYLRNCKNATLCDSSTAKLCDSSSAMLYDNSTAMLYDNSTATLYGSSAATLYRHSAATLWGSSTAKLCDSSSAMLYDNSTATLYGSSAATLYGSSTAKLWGSSTATLRDNSTGIIPNNYLGGKRNAYVLMDNSTLKDCKTKTVYQAGDWKYVEVK